MARRVFRGKVHIGYLAAIVAASNAGGAGSVRRRHHHHHDVDRRRVSPLEVLHAYVAAVAGAGDLRHPGGAPAAPPLADR